uniref:Uncharacterized protein n=1 Tax=Physcomitrium patens TaxID=3218 RepID=A0A2K1IR49_PHYPA|nr:hypothetical protein PHYPA_025874 [Physcomitrium patens]
MCRACNLSLGWPFRFPAADSGFRAWYVTIQVWNDGHLTRGRLFVENCEWF